MFDLLANSTKRRAMQKALKELDAEHKEAQENTSLIERTYQEEPTVTKVNTTVKNKGALNKAETTAVDLKNFKNWRNVNNVKSSNPKYIGNPFTKTSFFDEDDEDDGSDVKPTTSNVKQTLKNEIESGKKIEQVKSQQEPKQKIDSISLIENISKKTDESITEKSTNFNQFEITRVRNQERMQNFRDLVNKKMGEDSSVNNSQTFVNINAGSPTSSTKSDKSESNSKENKLKIEVVVPETKKIVVERVREVEKVKQPTKKPVNRKPRGKNKRKFDADVISSINWK